MSASRCRGSCLGGRGWEQGCLARGPGKQTSWPGLAEHWRQEWAPGPLACSYLLGAGAARASAHRAGEFHKNRERNQNLRVGEFQASKKAIGPGPSGSGRTREVGGGCGRLVPQAWQEREAYRKDRAPSTAEVSPTKRGAGRRPRPGD